MRNRLDELEEKQPLGIEAQIFSELDCDLTKKQADSLGRLYDANLVIWGNYGYCADWDSSLINVKYLSMDAFQYAKVDTLLKGESGLQKVETLESFSKLESGEIAGKVIDDVVYWSLGVRAFFKKDYGSAVEMFSKINLRKEKEYSQIWYFLGLSKGLVGEDGFEEIELAGELDPEGTAGLLMQGGYYQVTGDLDSALYCYTAAIQQNPFDPILFLNRGEAYTMMKSFDSALVDFEHALELFPGFEKHMKAREICFF